MAHTVSEVVSWFLKITSLLVRKQADKIWSFCDPINSLDPKNFELSSKICAGEFELWRDTTATTTTNTIITRLYVVCLLSTRTKVGVCAKSRPDFFSSSFLMALFFLLFLSHARHFRFFHSPSICSTSSLPVAAPQIPSCPWICLSLWSSCALIRTWAISVEPFRTCFVQSTIHSTLCRLPASCPSTFADFRIRAYLLMETKQFFTELFVQLASVCH